MPQVISITSESLQAKIRELLPSQQGFGEDLQASNVILPIIDLTSTSSGSTLPIDLQNAAAFGSQTVFQASSGTVTLTSTPGFYKLIGVATAQNGSGAQAADFNMSDGLSTKKIWELDFPTGGSGSVAFDFELIVFVATGITLSATSSGANSTISGSFRQIADVNGVAVDPSGYTPQ